MAMMPYTLRSAHRRSAQAGVVLIIALITMALIAISSAAAIRVAMSQDQVGSAMRAQSLALQAAETMLRYCEAAVTASVPTAAQVAVIRNIQPQAATGTPLAWRNINNWNNNLMVSTLPVGFQLDGSGAAYSRQPQCMVQEILLAQTIDRLNPTTTSYQAFLVVARGFSPDYAATNNVGTAGAEVWLESTVQVAN